MQNIQELTNGIIKQNLDNSSDTRGSSSDPDQRLKDLADIRAFINANEIWGI